jgi:hypothetical protein
MPYDPNIPADHAELTGAMFRGQFNGLKDLIDTIPVGPPGQNGSDGTSVTGAIIDGTNTLNPGDAAQASVSWDGANVRFTFGIPRGQDGVSSPPITSFIVDGVNTLNPGEPATANASFDGSSVRLLFGIPRGSDGTNGSNGSDGSQGPPFTNFIVDGVNMLNPTDPASVQSNFDGNAVRMIFNIPRGFTGNDGAAGTPGSNGNDGGQGPPFTNFIVDGVNMLNPTDPASVQTNFDGNAVRMVFNLPRGFTGNDGGTGAQGGPGPQGPPFANAIVDSVTTLNPGDNATVQTSFDGSNVRFQFGIPRGFNGNDGGSGPQGSPGEVSNVQLNSAINGTSNNTNAVSLVGMTVSDPPTVGEVQAIASKLDELILALRR